MQAFHGLQTFSIYSTVKLPDLHIVRKGGVLFCCMRGSREDPQIQANDLLYRLTGRMIFLIKRTDFYFLG